MLDALAEKDRFVAEMGLRRGWRVVGDVKARVEDFSIV